MSGPLVRWPHRKLRKLVPAKRDRVLRALADLSAESGREYVPTQRVIRRLGRSRGLGAVLDDLIRTGHVERGPARDGGWGDRPTEMGYRSLMRHG